MKSFHYYNPSALCFGQGAERELSALLRRYQAHALMLVYSGDFVKTLGIWDVVRGACDELGIPMIEEGGVAPNPRLELVHDLIARGKAQGVDFVLAVGGGSSVDTAKAVAMGIGYDGDVWDFFTGRAEPAQVLPVGVITTLPASGSETSNCAIITNGLYKLGYEDDRIIPKFAIMNPEYTLNLPAYQTACGIADILSHLLERYFSAVSHTDTTDYLIEGAVRALLVNARRLLKNPKDLDARSEIQWLASIAHNNLLDTGREADWGSHRIEHELSAQYGLTHGEGMAVVLPAWVRYAAANRPEKPAQLAARVFGYDYVNDSPGDMALGLADELERFFRSLKLRTRLSELQIGEGDFETMALRATKGDTAAVGHYIPLNCARILEILKLAR